MGSEIKKPIRIEISDANKKLAGKLKGLIDPCGFETVKQHFRAKNSEISQVALIQGDYLLHEIATVFEERAEGINTAKLVELLEAGIIKYGVDNLEKVESDFRKYAVLLDSIPDNQLCHVIYLPPIYIVKVADKKWI